MEIFVVTSRMIWKEVIESRIHRKRDSENIINLKRLHGISSSNYL